MNKEREESDNENSTKIRSRQLKGRQSKKNTQSRDLLHYFPSINKPQGAPQSNLIPQSESNTLEEVEAEIENVEQKQIEMREKIAEMKVKLDGQKQSMDYFTNRVKAITVSELKKTAEVDRLVKRQKKRQLLIKINSLRQLERAVSASEKQMQSGDLSQGQAYFYQKDMRLRQEQLDLLKGEIEVLREQVRLSQEEQNCILAREGWPLLYKKYQPLCLLGRGGFSQVYKAYSLESSSLVAVKLSSVEHLLTNANNRQEYLRHIKRQYQTHKTLTHPNIVRLIEFFELESAICLVLEYCQGFTLAQYLKNQGTIEENQTALITRQLVEVLCYLSSQNPAVIHYDLKPQNIMFHRGGIKVLDFGICKTMDNEHSKMALTSQGVGSYWYLPPETFSAQNPTISGKVDIWSLGVICYEMLEGKRPFGQSTMNGATLHRQCSPLTFQQEISQEATDFVRQCLNFNERQRVDSFTALSHPFLNRTHEIQAE